MLAVPALLSLLTSPAFCWSGHNALTHQALKGLPGLATPVKVESLRDYLVATGFKGTDEEFLRALQVNPKTALPFSAGEVAGGSVAASAILETYSDEPDAGLDNDIFATYPNLWKPEYIYMGGQLQGLGSRFVRHMFWPAGYLTAPPPGGKLPVRVSRTLGEAPERAQLYFDLSQFAYRTGHPYWGARFLAWSLHYVEDVSQPFHAEQVPAMAFLHLNPDATFDIEGSVRRIVYYHMVFESLATQSLRGDLGTGPQSRLSGALASTATEVFAGAAELAKETAKKAQLDAYETGRVCLTLFPFIDDPTNLDPPSKVGDPAFWEEVKKTREANPALYERFMKLVAARFADAGAAARALVVSAQALAAAAAAPQPSLPPSLNPALLPQGARSMLESRSRLIEGEFGR